MKMLAGLNSRFKIGTRIAAGFFAIQALLAIVAAVAYFGLGTARQNYETYANISGNAANFLNAERGITGVRRNMLIYMQSGDPQVLERIARGSKIVRDSLTEVVNTAMAEERREAARQMLASFEQLSKTIETIAKAYPERQAAIKSVNDHGDRLRTVMSNVLRGSLQSNDMATAGYAGAAQEEMMMIRVNANRYLVTNDAKLIETSEQHFAKAKSAIELVGDAAKNPQHSADVSRMEREFPAYLRELKNVAKISDDIFKMEAEANKIGDALTQQTTQIRTTQLKLLEEVRASSDSAMSQASWISLIVTGVAMLVGFVLAWFIGRGVSKPILALGGTMQSLADGNLQVDVKGTERGDEIGQMAKTVLTFRDGALEKAAKDALNADYAGQIAAIGKAQAVIEFNLDGTIRGANENFLNAMGYTIEEIKGQHHAMFVDAAHRDSAEYRQFWEKLGSGEYDAGQYKRITKAGKEIWIQASYNPIRDLSGTPFKVVKYATDITEQRLRNADFEGQISAIGKAQAVVEFGMDGKVWSANENFLRTMGYTLDEIKGQHHSLFVEASQRQSAEYRQFWEKLNRGESDDVAGKRVTKAGKEIWLRARYNPILDLNGRPFKVVEYATEITDQVKATQMMQLAVQQTQDVVKAAGANDLTKRVPLEGKSGEIEALCAGVNNLIDTMVSVISEIKSAALEVANASGEIATATTDLSQRTEEQAASLEQTSASMEQISVTVKKNAENAQHATQSATGTRDVAGRGGEVVAQAVQAMSRIEESSSKISDIIGVIDEIARQTNLLALNAAVEAARAGDAGRGFAVVASEVRSLAQRSSQAAKDIKDLINNSTTQVKDGVDLVNRAGDQLKEIMQSIKGVADIVNEIAAASAEQSSGIDQVNKALTQMDEVTQQNSALVEQNAATAKTLEQQSAAMSARVGVFKLNDSAGGEAHRPAAAAPKPQPSGVAAKPQQPAPAPKAPQPAAAAGAKSAPAPKAKPAPGATVRGPVGRMQSALAMALKDDPDWKEF